MESITEFVKVFCEKIWFWLIVSVFSLIALFSEETFQWLGFEARNRWIVGIVAVLALSLLVQCICDLYGEYSYRKRMIKRIDNFTKDEENLLKDFVAKNKQTFHVKSDRERDARLVCHFELKVDKRGYVTIPDYLWKELKKRYEKMEH